MSLTVRPGEPVDATGEYLVEKRGTDLWAVVWRTKSGRTSGPETLFSTQEAAQTYQQERTVESQQVAQAFAEQIAKRKEERKETPVAETPVAPKQQRITKKSVGARLAAARIGKSMTQLDVERDALGSTTGSNTIVSKIERGITGLPENVKKIADFLGLQLTDREIAVFGRKPAHKTTRRKAVRKAVEKSSLADRSQQRSEASIEKEFVLSVFDMALDEVSNGVAASLKMAKKIVEAKI